MARYMRKGDLRSLLNRLIDQNSGTLGDTDGYRAHCLDSFEYGADIASDIHRHYRKKVKGLPRSEVMAIGGGVHDIGRPLRKNQQGHELRGAAFLRQYGVEVCVARNQAEADMYADWIQRHFVIYEEWMDDKNTELREEFPWVTDPNDMLLPKTWPHRIVIAADLSNIRGSMLHYIDRLDDLVRRYKDTRLGECIKKGRPRLEHDCSLVERFGRGDLSNDEINRYLLI